MIPFIAETGGINAMIVDSSALPEQVVRDAVRSAFDSAGQRCSAARVIYIQEEIAPHVIEMLSGATAALDIGDPLDYATDIGPVIDQDAQDALEAHKVRMQRQAVELIDVRVPADCRVGTYVSPAIYEIDSLEVLEREVFGPILHVLRFKGSQLDKVIDAINATGFGLTLGLHSRIAGVADTSPSMPASATCTSTATRSAPSSAFSRSAARACPAPAPRPAGPTTWPASPPSASAPPTSRPRAATCSSSACGPQPIEGIRCCLPATAIAILAL